MNYLLRLPASRARRRGLVPGGPLADPDGRSRASAHGLALRARRGRRLRPLVRVRPPASHFVAVGAPVRLPGRLQAHSTDSLWRPIVPHLGQIALPCASAGPGAGAPPCSVCPRAVTRTTCTVRASAGAGPIKKAGKKAAKKAPGAGRHEQGWADPRSSCPSRPAQSSQPKQLRMFRRMSGRAGCAAVPMEGLQPAARPPLPCHIGAGSTGR